MERLGTRDAALTQDERVRENRDWLRRLPHIHRTSTAHSLPTRVRFSEVQRPFGHVRIRWGGDEPVTPVSGRRGEAGARGPILTLT